MGNGYGDSESYMEKAMQDLVNLSTEEKLDQAAEYFSAIWPELRRLDPEYDGKILLYYILGTAVGADGQLTESEAALMNAVMDAVDVEWSVDDTIKMMENVADRDGYDTVKKLVHAFDEDLQADLISFIAVICAIDDRIKVSEQSFILDLIDACAD